MRYLYLLFSSLYFNYLVYCLKDQISPTYGSHQLITYVVDWDLPEVIPFEKLDHIAYAFAIPDRQGNLREFDKEKLKNVVEEAHNHGKGVSIAIGGWTGSIYFSTLVRTSASRRSFARNIVQMVHEFKLNGVNLDWEYPNDPSGISCNIKHPKDTDNFLAFIQILRQMLDDEFPEEHVLITAAVSTQGFRDVDRHYLSKLDDGWAEFMDAFYIMAYDVNGIYSKVASPNAPLYYGSTGQHVSVASSIQYWMDAGIPSERIYLGVPFYGYTHKTKKDITHKTGLNAPLDRSIPQIQGDRYDEYAADPCPGSRPTYSGEFQWRSIEESGAAYNASGWATYWDQRTRTAFAYNENNHQFITFDNPTSLRLKAQFVKENTLGGVFLWSLEMDDSGNSLLSALQEVRT